MTADDDSCWTTVSWGLSSDDGVAEMTADDDDSAAEMAADGAASWVTVLSEVG